jgi:hypothetical protein
MPAVADLHRIRSCPRIGIPDVQFVPRDACELNNCTWDDVDSHHTGAVNRCSWNVQLAALRSPPVVPSVPVSKAGLR